MPTAHASQTCSYTVLAHSPNFAPTLLLPMPLNLTLALPLPLPLQLAPALPLPMHLPLPMEMDPVFMTFFRSARATFIGSTYPLPFRKPSPALGRFHGFAGGKLVSELCSHPF